MLFFLLGIGIFFRFVHLDHQVYWMDEALTSLRASGYTEQEVVQHFLQTSVARVTELQRYQHPDGTKSVIDTIQSLAKEDPHFSPFYYILANFWFQSIGSSPAVARLLPALLSLLAFPSAYWLCQELFLKTGVFAASLPVWIAVEMIAISPFQMLYARESRHYSLWTVTTLLSTAALLRAVRRNTKTSWGIYALTLAMVLYTCILSVLMALTHGIYVIVIYGVHHIKILRAYLVASLLGGLAFLPWIWIVITNFLQVKKVTNWTAIVSLRQSDLMNSWVQIFGRVFFDVNYKSWDFYVHRVLLVLIVYAFYYLCRKTPISVWLMIILLTVGSALPLMLTDLVLGGIRSITARYFVPSLLGVQLAIAYLLGKKLTNFSSRPLQQQLWRSLLVVLVSGSILSCVVNAQASVPWTKTFNGENIPIAKVVNQASRPLLVSETLTSSMLSLSHLLKPSVIVFIQPRCQVCQNPPPSKFRDNLSALERMNSFSDVFLYDTLPSNKWLQYFAKQLNYKFEPAVFSFTEWEKDKPALWRFTPKSRQEQSSSEREWSKD